MLRLSEHIYLRDTYTFTTNTIITSFEETHADFKKHGSHKLIFENTVFHPQGGGQPSDIGFVYRTESNKPVFKVAFVQVNRATSAIEHFGFLLDETEVTSGDLVKLEIDKELRLFQARLHSAGHIMDAAMIKAGYDSSMLKPTKGYHFADGPYVEFQLQSGTKLNDEQINKLVDGLNEELVSLIAEDIKTRVDLLSREEASLVCGCDTTNYPETVRVVEVAGSKCPCGGTHVKSSQEIGAVLVTKIKKKKDILRVSYLLAEK